MGMHLKFAQDDIKDFLNNINDIQMEIFKATLPNNLAYCFLKLQKCFHNPVIFNLSCLSLYFQAEDVFFLRSIEQML